MNSGKYIPMDQVIIKAQAQPNFIYPGFMVTNQWGTFFQALSDKQKAYTIAQEDPNRYVIQFNSKGNPVFGRC